jgi:hypothetical protein
MNLAGKRARVLEIDDRGFVPEFALFATNPW